MADKQSVVINQIASGWSEQVSFYRFLHNKQVTEEALANKMRWKCEKGVRPDSHVLVISGTTLIDYSAQRGCVKENSGLGFIGDHDGWGYNLHGSMAVCADDTSILGISDAFLWHRTEAKNDTRENYYGKPFEGKESHRWASSCNRSKAVVKGAGMVTFVQDREGDMYDTFVLVPEERHHLLVRSKYDRNITTALGGRAKLRSHLSAQGPCITYELEVRGDSHKRTAHTALLEVRYATVLLERGDNAAYQRSYPRQVRVQAVHVSQCPQSVPSGEDPIEWTTHTIEDFADAVQIVYWYTLRWLIEDFFRLLKKKGFQLESSELETGYALRRLGMITMDSAVQAMQLRQARDGQSHVQVEAVFTEGEQSCLEKLCPRMEGNTGKMKNPHPDRTLPWASWIIARLGGWKGYQSQRPPGVITFKRGLDRFKAIYFGQSLGP